MAQFLHKLSDVKQLFEVVAKERFFLPIIFELKGGTSLSKGFNIIERFSEDIDVQIFPDPKLAVKIGKNHDKNNHIAERANFFNQIATELNIPDMKFYRDHNFDDKQ